MAFEAKLLLNLYGSECCRQTLSQKEQLRHRAVSLRQHGFLVIHRALSALISDKTALLLEIYYQQS